MGLYNCARCDGWYESEVDPPSFDEAMPASSTLLLCGACCSELAEMALDEALDDLFRRSDRPVRRGG